MKLRGGIICARPAVYTTPPHLRPVALWRLRLADGQEAPATLAPTAEQVAAVWYLGELLQDAAEFPTREAAIAWSEEVRRMLLVPFQA